MIYILFGWLVSYRSEHSQADYENRHTSQWQACSRGCPDATKREASSPQRAGRFGTCAARTEAPVLP